MLSLDLENGDINLDFRGANRFKPQSLNFESDELTATDIVDTDRGMMRHFSIVPRLVWDDVEHEFSHQRKALKARLGKSIHGSQLQYLRRTGRAVAEERPPMPT
ncbi:MAG: hypothetical protein LBM19_00010 [Holosporales bacterium]|nr:hypothetical protein [Holosporales bacterium]